MAEEHEHHGIMAELAQLWEEDHEQMGQAPGNKQRSDAQVPITDPFLLPGDEQTWDPDDWFLDPATLLAAPKESLASAAPPCCQAFKRRKLPPEILPALQGLHGGCGHSSAGAHQGKGSAAAGNAGYTPANSSSATGVGCCNFQMPTMHLPSLNTAGGALNQFQGLQALQPPVMPGTSNSAVGMGGACHAAWAPGQVPGGATWPCPTPPAAAAMAHTFQPPLPQQPSAAAMLNAGQHQQQLDPAMSGVAQPDLTAALLAMQHQQLSQAVTAAGMAAPGVVPQAAWNTLPAANLLAPALPPAPTPQLQPPQAAAVKAATAMPRRPSVHDPTPDPDSDSDGEGAAGAGIGVSAANAGTVGMSAGGVAARKATGLQPATYTGRLEDVVVLSDHCPDDASRLVCQVAGCGKDLSGAKDYHQRYRICDVHIKLPQVLKDGRLQRFCQQCGRFHDLAAFDANRKSCREQLNKHNARRRRRAQIEAQKNKAMEQLTNSTAGLVSVLAGAAGAGGGGGGYNGGNNNGCGGEAGDGASGQSAPAGGPGGAGVDGALDVGRLLSALMQNPTHLHALRLLLGVQTHPALPVLHPFSPEATSPPAPTASVDRDSKAPAAPAASTPTPVPLSITDGPACSAPSPPPAAVPEPASYGLARDMADGKGAWAPNYESDHRALRISMKLFNRTPADLPHDLRQQVTGWLSSMPAAVSGAIRPGCVFLTLHMLVSKAVYEDALKRGLASFLAHLRSQEGCALWHEGAYVVQLGAEMALVAGGRVTAYYCDPAGPKPQAPVALEALTPSSSPSAASCCPRGGASGVAGPQRYPVVSRMTPVCVQAPSTSRPTHLQITLHGQNLALPGCELVLRQRGVQLRLPLRASAYSTSATADVPFTPPGAAEAGSDSHHGGHVSAVARTLSHCGVVWVEVARGAWMSPARPLLILNDPAVAAEIAELQSTSCRAELSQQDLDSLLVDLGMVLAHVNDHHTQPHTPPHTAASGRMVGCFTHMDHHTVSLKARRLLLFACDMGWAALAARMLPLATSNCACAAEVVAAVHASSAVPAAAVGQCKAVAGTAGGRGSKARGLSLLHRVVRSGNLALLQGVLHWGQVAGYAWRADRNGPGGITPLHLAALQEDPRILMALLDYAPPSAFTCLRAQDGTTPFHLAFQMGHYTLDAFTGLLADNKLLPNDTLSANLAAGFRSGQRGPMAAVLPGAGGREAAEQGAGEVVTAAGPNGREVDPCTKCHCKLPPLVLSIAASCVTCGERVPCLGPLEGSAGDDTTTGHKPGSGTGHDAARCAGCTTKQQHQQQEPRSGVTGAARAGETLSGRKRPLGELCDAAGSWLEGALPGQWSPDVANNCTGVAAGCPHAADAPQTHAHTHEEVCDHHHGSVFSIMALCQGCHSNRTLEVM